MGTGEELSIDIFWTNHSKSEPFKNRDLKCSVCWWGLVFRVWAPTALAWSAYQIPTVPRKSLINCLFLMQWWEEKVANHWWYCDSAHFSRKCCSKKRKHSLEIYLTLGQRSWSRLSRRRYWFQVTKFTNFCQVGGGGAAKFSGFLLRIQTFRLNFDYSVMNFLK